MGQKVCPIGFRTGITLPWRSTWYAPKSEYGQFLVEDQKIREFVDKKYNRSMPKGAVSKTEIVRTRNEIKVTLHSGRPGIVIGPRGNEVEKTREELEARTNRKININVVETKQPELDAKLVAEGIAEKLEKRASFRRTMKMESESVMNAGAKGVKIICSGRLGGSELARTQAQKIGSIPLHTLEANVDYGFATARTTYGSVGVKVWIHKGRFDEQDEPQAKPASRPAKKKTGKPRGSTGKSGAGKKPKAKAKPKTESKPEKAQQEQSKSDSDQQ